jgi:hypothetical protein
MVICKITSSPNSVLRLVDCAECDIPTAENNVSSETEEYQQIEYETEGGRHKHLADNRNVVSEAFGSWAGKVLLTNI